MGRPLQNLQTSLEFSRIHPWGRAPHGAWAFLSRYRANAFKVYRRGPARTSRNVPNRTAVHAVRRNLARFTPPGASRELILVEAHVELAFGQGLFIRGEGAGLSWQKGDALKNTAPGTWLWVAVRPQETVVFQLLLNDSVWARGENITVKPGERVLLEPDFEWPEIPRFAVP